MNATTIAAISSSVLGLYMIATAIGNVWPSTRFGKLCLRFALILGAVEKALPESQRAERNLGRMAIRRSLVRGTDIEEGLREHEDHGS
jgi:hypothetical protein